MLKSVMPGVATELRDLLVKEGHPELAAQIGELEVVDRCRCGDDFCAMFYCAPKPQGGYGPGHENIELEPKEGMLILDVVDGKVVAVELLYRNEIRDRLKSLLP